MLSGVERMAIAERQGMSEGKNFEEKSTQSKTDFSSCSGIYLAVNQGCCQNHAEQTS